MNGDHKANLEIGVNRRDRPQDNFEGTESFSGLLRGIDVNGDTPKAKHCALLGFFRSWWTLKEIQRNDDIYTHPSMPLLAHPLSPQHHRCPHLMREIEICMNIGPNRRDERYSLVGLFTRPITTPAPGAGSSRPSSILS